MLNHFYFQEVFNERVKIFKLWKEAEAMLAKKREAKAKLELARKIDKIPGAAQEVTEVRKKYILTRYCITIFILFCASPHLLFTEKKFTFHPSCCNTFWWRKTKLTMVSVQKLSESISTLAKCMFKQSLVASQTVTWSNSTLFLSWNG